jgi:hypothetical protein
VKCRKTLSRQRDCGDEDPDKGAEYGDVVRGEEEFDVEGGVAGGSWVRFVIE